MSVIEKINSLRTQIETLPDTIGCREDLENLRNKFLSKKGLFTELFTEFKNVSGDEKRTLGAQINSLKGLVEAKLQSLQAGLRSSATTERLDLTRSPEAISVGTRHPLSLVSEKIIDIFTRVGFTLAEGPEIEDDEHVFSLLNFPLEHPARDMQDTFYISKEPERQSEKDVLLRTHTSSVQTRVMLHQQPPIRVLCPGRVYRNEAISARAHCFFHQIEGLYIDKGVSFADLRQVLLFFAQEMFGDKTRIRLRPSYFPFTEPSAEMDISCDICGGKGCSFCKGTGWVEILGCGMVDPNVLEACGIDSKTYTGYAFGLGVERITNLKYKVKDLRLFSENDARFLDMFV